MAWFAPFLAGLGKGALGVGKIAGTAGKAGAVTGGILGGATGIGGGGSSENPLVGMGASIARGYGGGMGQEEDPYIQAMLRRLMGMSRI